jgi:hypothetical protein
MQMQPPQRRIPSRRLAILGGALVFSVLSCGREPTGAEGEPPTGIRYSHGIAFNPVFPPGYAELVAAQRAAQTTPAGLTLANQTSGSGVAFEKVRVILRNPDGSIALDELVDFAPGATEVTHTFNVPLPASAPSGGVPLALTLAYTNAAGQVVFTGGPVTVTAVPAVAGQPAPPPSPVTIPLNYTGTGSNATSVQISPPSVAINMNAPFTFTAVARDANNVVVPNTPIVFSIANPNLATISSATGGGVAKTARGTTTVTAALLTGPTSAATLTVNPVPGAIAFVSGPTQPGKVNQTLTAPAVVRVTALDGLPMAGATVAFAAAGGGTMTPASAPTGGDGTAQATWKLGPTVGPQTATATLAGIGSVNFSATAQPADPVRLVVVTAPPASVVSGTAFGLSVRAVDETGAPVNEFTNGVTLTLGGGFGTLSGVTTVASVGGLATFSGLSITTAGSYTLTATSGALTAATAPVVVTAGNPSRLSFTAYPTGGIAGNALGAATVTLFDANNNPATNFNGAVTIALGSSPGGATLAGTLTATASSGVATFSGLVVTVAGGYSLTASASGTSVTGGTFIVGPNAPKTLTLSSGGGQSGAGGAALPLPISVKVIDAYGNGVGGQSVTFAPLTGSAAPNPVITGSTGFALTIWTLGPAAGPQTMNVSSGGLTPNPLVVNANAATAAGPGPATQMVFSTQPSNATAGASISPAIVVTAKDAGGAVATSFTGAVSLAITTNPGSGTLAGTLTQNAVSGVATFSNISINNAGTGYVLTASSTLPSVASSPFNITAGTATQIAAFSGTGQGGTVGTALAAPFVVKVTDGSGNPVSGAPVVWAVTGGGGSLGGTTTTTNGSGQAQATLTMGPTAGTNTVTATSGTLIGSPVTFTASSAAGTATKLVFTVQPSNAVAGVNIAPGIVVQAQDAFNNLVTSYATTVALAISTNPGGATLGGTTSGPPSGGQTTFNAVNLNKIGTGYVLTATSGALTAGVSTGFNITAAAASAIIKETGDAQSVNVPAPLAAPIVARVNDAFGNPVAGQTVTWGTPTLGGNLTATTTTTDANGRVQATWNLTTAGPQTVTATWTSSTVTFTSTGTSAVANAVWTGATSNVWELASNWSPAAIPLATDAVLIQAGGTQPVLGGNTTVKDLYIATGATLSTGGFVLTVTGNLDAGTTITGGGTVNLTGTGTMKGRVNGNVNVTGTYTVVGPDSVGGSLTVGGAAGSLTIGAFEVKVDGHFSTATNGVLNMTTAGGILTVLGDVGFGGGTNNLTNGIVQLNGNFLAASGHNPSGAHQTWILGGTATVTLSGTPGTNTFNHVLFNAGTPTMQTRLDANSVILGVGITNLNGLNASIGARVRDSIIDPNNRWNLSKVWFYGPNVKIGNSLNVATVNFVGGGTTTLLANAAIGGSVVVDSASTLAMGAFGMTVAGTFTTQNNGKLSMTNPASAMTVVGNATFSGGAQTGLLTNGVLTMQGNFSQTAATSNLSFAATAAHTTVLSGTANQTITFATPDTAFTGCVTSCFGVLNVTKTGGTVDFTTGVKTVGVMSVAAGTTGVTATGGVGTPRPVIVLGNFTSAAAPTVNLDRVAIGGTVTIGAATTIDSITFLGTGQNISGTFAHATVRGTALATGALTTTGPLLIKNGSLTVNGQTVTVGGGFVTDSAGTLNMTNGADILDVTGNTTFMGGTSTMTQGVLRVRGDFFQGGPAAVPTSFVASGAHITRFMGTTDQNVTFGNVNVASVSPSTGSCPAASCFNEVQIQKASGKLIFQTSAQMVSHFTFTNAPDSVTAYAPRRIFVAGNYAPTTLTVGGRIGLLMVGGAAPNNAAMQVDSLVLNGSTNVDITPAFDLQVYASSAITGGTRVFPGSVRALGAGSLTLSATDITINGNFATGGTATFTQSSENLVTVKGNVTLAGGTSAPSAGRFVVEGDFTTTGAAFQASGTNRLEITGDGCVPQTVTGSAVVAGQGVRHLKVGGSKTKVFAGDLRVVGDLDLRTTLTFPVTGPTGTVRVGGDFRDSSLAGAAAGAWQVANTEFFGSNTINAAFMTTNVTISGGTVHFVTVGCVECAQLREPATPRRGASMQASAQASILNPSAATVTGNMTVTGSSAMLDVDDNTILVFGNFSTASGGTLQMLDPQGYLFVSGNASFGGGPMTVAGGAPVERLIAGDLEVIGNFTEGGGSTDAFAAGPNHSTYIGDYYASLVASSSALRAPAATDARRSKITAAQRATHEARQRLVDAASRERSARRAQLVARRNALLARQGVSLQAGDGGRRLRGSAQIMASVLMPSTITFAHPTTSWFGYLYLQGEQINLGSDMLVKDQFGTGGVSHTITSASPRTITSHGADVSYTSFVNTRWVLLDGAPAWNMSYVTFSGMSTSVDPFTINRESDTGCDGPCYLDMYYWTFNTVPGAGNYYVNATDGGGIDPLKLVFTAPFPSPHGGKVLAPPPVIIEGWAASFTWLGTSEADGTNWFDTENWSAGVIPDYSDNVTIPSGAPAYPRVFSTISTRDLTIGTGASIEMVGPTLYVHGNLSAPTATTAVTCGDGGYLTLYGNSAPFNTVTGKFCNMYVEGNYRVSTQVITEQELYIYGNLNVNGGSLHVGQLNGTSYGTLYTQNSGTLTMQNSADRVYVGTGGAWFEGGSTTGLLTDGILTIVSSATESSCLHALNYYAAPDAFAPSGAHKVVFSGPSAFAAKVEFYFAQSFLNHAEILPGSGMMLGSDVTVKGTLSRGSGSGGTLITMPGSRHTLSVTSLNFSSAELTTVNNVLIYFYGSGSATFDNVAWTGFTDASSGALFRINSPATSYTFNGWNFSGAGFAASATDRFVINEGAANITIAGANPSPGVAGTHYFQAGGGTITWP